jgi:putative ABC transport system substrate-binding protein
MTGIEGSLSRRRFVQGAGVAGIGLLAACGRLPGQAAPARVPRVGVVLGAAPATSPAAEALRQGLREAGYVEGQNVWIEFREADGRNERLGDLAAELVRLPVDVLVTAGPPAIRAAKGATDTIPIVMATSGAADPVAEGLVASLARPGSNVTGLSALAPQLNPKRLQLLTESVPGVARVAVLSGRGNLVAISAELREAAALLGVELDALPVSEPHEVEESLEAAARAGAGALLVFSSNLLLAQRRLIGELAAWMRLPAMFDDKGYVDAGGLMAYGASATYSWRRAAYYVDRILKGTSPADLPIEQPREFDFVVNLKAAQALGLTIPQHVFLQATEVIQ